MRTRRWIARAIDAVILLVILPLVLLPVAVAAGSLLFASAAGDCGEACEGPGQLGMLVWASLVLITWVAYRPALRRLRRRTIGQCLARALTSGPRSRSCER